MVGAGGDTEEMQKMKVARKRIAIAADTLTSSTGVKIPSIPKTEAVFRVLGAGPGLAACELRQPGEGLPRHAD